MANGKAFGPNKLPVEPLNPLLDDDARLSSFHDTIVETWKEGMVT